MVNTRVRSPFIYMGGKYALVDKIFNLILDSKDGVFWDLLGGSGTMSFNAAKVFKQVVYNEKMPHVYKIVRFLLSLDTQEKVDAYSKWADDLAMKYNIITVKNNCRSHESPHYKNWLNFIDKENINIDSHPKLLFLTHLFTFSHKLEFSPVSKKLIKSYRNRRVIPSRHIKKCLAFLKIRNITCFNLDYLALESRIQPADFVYLDPPYILTNAVYNDNWSPQDEQNLYAFCDRLNTRKVRFLMSNVWVHKGRKHQTLAGWSQKRGYQVEKWAHIYTSNGTNNKVVECCVRNYVHYNHPQPTRLF